MNARIIILSALFIFAVVEANAQVVTHKYKKSAVAEQEVKLETAFNLDADCQSSGEIRVAIIKAPKNGRVIQKPTESIASYKKDNPRSSCNGKKVQSTSAIFVANPGFRGTENFMFGFVFADGTLWRYDVEMTVWGPP